MYYIRIDIMIESTYIVWYVADHFWRIHIVEYIDNKKNHYIKNDIKNWTDL